MPAFIDRDGDLWETTGDTENGQPLLICPDPSNPDDWGDPDAPPVPRPMDFVASWFGPLTAAADLHNAA